MAHPSKHRPATKPASPIPSMPATTKPIGGGMPSSAAAPAKVVAPRRGSAPMLPAAADVKAATRKKATTPTSTKASGR